MITRIDHISIAVTDYESARHFFQDILGAIPGAASLDDTMKYQWQLFSIGDLSRLELLKPLGDGSFLEKFLSRHPEGGVHHITFETSSIQESMKLLEQHQIPYFGYNEYVGGVWKEIFIHPKHAYGVLIQIAEFHPNDWLNSCVQLKKGQKWSFEKQGDGYILHFSHPGGGKMTLNLSSQEVNQLLDDLKEIII
ncbi:MAG: VOC family protein [Desulfobacterales bacterium]|nr:VOC family protein [Desulfobacterales bacterium]